MPYSPSLSRSGPYTAYLLECAEQLTQRYKKVINMLGYQNTTKSETQTFARWFGSRKIVSGSIFFFERKHAKVPLSAQKRKTPITWYKHLLGIFRLYCEGPTVKKTYYPPRKRRRSMMTKVHPCCWSNNFSTKNMSAHSVCAQ